MATLTAKPIVPARAPVVPRGQLYDGGETLPLETHIRALIRNNASIAILGSGGSGKSTAIAHLAHVLSDLPIDFFDESTDVYAAIRKDRAVVASFAALPTVVEFDVVLTMAPWEEAERIDYLLARHPEQTRSVMERLKDAEWTAAFFGSPRLWSVVLDQMAANPALTDIRRSLRDMMNAILAMFEDDAARTREIMASAARSQIRNPAGVPAFLQHEFMLQLAFVEELFDSLEESPASHWWQSLRDPKLQRDLQLIELIAARLRGEASGTEHLRRRVASSSCLGANDVIAQAPMVTVLVALDRSFRPATNIVNLDHVEAAGVDWSGLRLIKPSLNWANLVRAKLNNIDWPGASAVRANLRQANLTGANLMDARLRAAFLDEASLPNAIMENADLTEISAVTANFNGARLDWADFRRADLRGASFLGASLYHAYLIDAQLAAADFTGATLHMAMCLGCDFRDSILTNATMEDATFDGSTFVDMRIEGFSAIGARFTKADLTGLWLRGATLKRATFRRAGLAHVDWEGADLRDCDFTHAAFHMGSSRSGLVGSPIACEGSRTGFYTDDYSTQDYQPPEAIRKANLCGANLTGAAVTGTDWYLVDLRGAKYSSQQAEWFRKCGAILFDRKR